MKYHCLPIIIATLITATLHPAFSQTPVAAEVEAPATLRVRVEHMQTRHKNAVTELTGTFERLAADPSLISSKEVVEAIDLGDRALKNTKATCGSILKTLRTKAKSIESESSFTDEQKTELLAAAESMIAKTEEVVAQCSATITHLEGAYKAMGQWRTIYRTYLDLDGEEKAREQLKVSVDEFIAGLTAAPQAEESEGEKPE